MACDRCVQSKKGCSHSNGGRGRPSKSRKSIGNSKDVEGATTDIKVEQAPSKPRKATTTPPVSGSSDKSIELINEHIEFPRKTQAIQFDALEGSPPPRKRVKIDHFPIQPLLPISSTDGETQEIRSKINNTSMKNPPRLSPTSDADQPPFQSSPSPSSITLHHADKYLDSPKGKLK